MKRYLIVGLVLVFLTTFGVMTAFAIDWTGNGADGGFCNNFQEDPEANPAPGQQAWHFILTDSDGTNLLSATFADGTVITNMPATKVTGKTTHWYVYTSAGTQLLSASATGTGNNLNVSHCEVNNPPSPLIVSKTANASYDRTWSWTIDKSVTPGSLDLFSGESGTAHYTIAVTKSGPFDSNWAVSGTISITNPATNTIAANITGVNDSLAPANCGVAFPYDLAPGATLNCTYSLATGGPTSGNNHVDVTTGNSVPGGSADAGFSFGAPTNETNASINVDDTNGSSYQFSDSGSTSYDRTFTCDGDNGNHQNTATIRETGQSDTADVLVNCYHLDVSKTANTSYDRTFDWTIEKSADPTTLDMFTGDSGDVTYTINVTKSDPIDSGWNVSGIITISNPAPIPATLTGVSDNLGPVDCGVGFPYVLGSGGTLQCSYSVALGSAMNGTNTAYAYLASAAFSGSADFAFGEPATVTDNSASVSDTNGQSWVFDNSGVQTYQHTFTCDADEGSHQNIATLTESNTGATHSDDATVTVNCYGLDVSKTAETSFDRTWSWTIDKSADTASVSIDVNETKNISYTVKVDGSAVDSGWSVSGTITVTNPAPMTASLSSVTDSLPGAVVDCGGVTEIAANSQLICAYSAPSDGSAGVNTATATLTNGTGFTSAEVPYSFGAPSNVVDECIYVTDPFAPSGIVGTVCATDGATTFTSTFAAYTYTVGPFDTCGEKPAVVNTATFSTTDTQTTGSDSVTIPVHVNCYWCSPGYWSQHQDVASRYVNLSSTYASMGAPYSLVPLKRGNPAVITLKQVLDSPSTYGGPAFNSVANYISSIAFAPNGGTQATGENCPLNARGEWTG